VARAAGVAEVAGASGVGHDVEAEPVAAQMLQRRELARGRVGKVRGRVDRRDHAEARRRLEEVRGQQQRVELRTAEGVPHPQVDGLGRAERGASSISTNSKPARSSSRADCW
jgi:hypothetical protein